MDLHSSGEDYNAPLNWAAQGEHVDVIRVLLDVTSQDNYGHSFARHIMG